MIQRSQAFQASSAPPQLLLRGAHIVQVPSGVSSISTHRRAIAPSLKLASQCIRTIVQDYMRQSSTVWFQEL